MAGLRPPADDDIPDEINTTYILKEVVGKGSYGTVYKAIDTKTGRTVAAKCIHGVFATRTDARRTLREMAILRRCHHNNVVVVVDVLRPKNPETFQNIWIIFEYCDYDLRRLCKHSSSVPDWGILHIKHFLYQILCALKYVHSMNIVHRDIKPSNILTNRDCNLKLIDFGLAREIIPTFAQEKQRRASVAQWEEETKALTLEKAARMTSPLVQRQLTTHVVTRYYRPPEVLLLTDKYSYKIDVWSVGCVFAELLQTLDPERASGPPRTVSPIFPGSGSIMTARKCDLNVDDMVSELKRDGNQLNVIIKVLGSPSDEDISCIEKSVLREAVSKLPKYPPIVWKEKFPYLPDDAIDLLEKMLVWNPDRRLSIAECIMHPFLREVRSSSRESDAESTVHFDFEEDVELRRDDYRRQILEEIEEYARRGKL